jgi:L-seryl-tRNA(Ser) seleniumtransferase
MTRYSSANRRRFLQGGGLLGLLGALPGVRTIAPALAARSDAESSQVYRRLGLRPIINAAGTYTHLGGSLMPPEVVDAMLDAGRHYVPIRDLSRAVGERIAQLTKNEAAIVTTGAAGAIFVATCVAIAGDDESKRNRLPFTAGMKNEVVCQNLHQTGWTRQCEAAGARIVPVEFKDEMERAITGKTAMLYYLVADKHFGQDRDRLDAPGGKVSLEECIEIAKRTRIPLLIDAAAELPPNDNLWKYTQLGADLVAFSGGKGLRGPQNAGLLVGRKDLIEKAHQFQSPYSGIGRDRKVSKETLIGTLAAVERYVNLDHEAEWKRWKDQVDHVKEQLSKVPDVETGYVPAWVTNHVPRLWVRWPEKEWRFSWDDCFRELQQGEPSVVPLRTPMGVTIVTWMMEPGQEEIVARRLKEVLTAAGEGASKRAAITDPKGDWQLDNPIDAWQEGADGLISNQRTAAD